MKSLNILTCILLLLVDLLAIYSCSLSPRATKIPTNPPVFTILSPKEGDTFYTNIINITGTTSNTGIGIKEVWLNVSGGTFSLVSQKENWSTNLALNYGTNTISVYAIDQSNNISTTNSLSFFIAIHAIYVSTNGKDSNDGLSTSTPVRSTVKAMELANKIDNSKLVLINVSTGTYTPGNGLSNENT